MAALDTRARVARLLQRTGFGVRTEDVDAAAKAGFDATLDRALGAGDDPGEKATPAPDLANLPRRGKNKDKNDPARKEFRKVAQQQRAELTLWWLDRMTAVEKPWREKRTFLWHDHWATSVQKVKSGEAMLAQNEILRRLGGGDFRALAREMVEDPALMLWLDASGNTAEAPNENLAREFMELFVLGVGNYEEKDVREAAAALTGWSVDRKSEDGWKARFRPRQHARGTQTVLGTTTDFTARALVDHLVEQAACPRHVASRFWARLVSSEDEPSKESLERMTDAYGKGRDIGAMLRALFTDPAFSEKDNVLVKQPVEYVVGSLRAFGLRPGKLPEQAARRLIRTLNGLGQVPFAPPNVGGWPHGAAWLTTAAAEVRIKFAQQLVQKADLGTVEKASEKERPETLARLLGVPEWGERSTQVLASASKDPRRVTAIALTAPEYLVLP
jgi:uncharacterized protein (DUF1800 family)